MNRCKFDLTTGAIYQLWYLSLSVLVIYYGKIGLWFEKLAKGLDVSWIQFLFFHTVRTSY